MKILKQNQIFKQILTRFYSSSITPFPYTDELYKKNYIKYPVQSKQAIEHDYVYDSNERLPTFEERLEEFKDPSEKFLKNIGKNIYFPNLKELNKSLNAGIAKLKSDKTMEKKSKELKLNVDTDKVFKQTKMMGSFRDVIEIINHYNINKDLFESFYFRPCLDLNVEFKIDESEKAKSVFYGNKIPAKYTSNQPTVFWEDLLKSIKEETLYHSLIFVNLDGNFMESNNEVLHWFLGNIKNNDFKSADELVNYIQPLPMRGSGWHRCVFVLFEHLKPINFKINKFNENETFIKKRTFKVSEFFSTYQNDILPVGISFFQTEWDLSVKKSFHEILQSKEPIYEFDFGQRFLPKFEKYPRNQVFNWYLDDYKDRKKINEEVMKDYMKNLSPFEPYPEPAKYPILDVDVIRPKWYKYELESLRKRKHQYSGIPYKHSHQNEKIKEFIKNLPYQSK